MRGPQRAKPRIATTRAPCRRSRMTGFSLIELAVVLVVLAVIAALGAPAFAQWIQNSHIRNATESLTHGMLRARAEAVQRNIGTSFSLGNGAFWTVTDLNTNQVIETRPAAEVPPSNKHLDAHSVHLESTATDTNAEGILIDRPPDL